jgi:hypothetical protein
VLKTTPMGFYRPIVSWSFALNYALFGLSPMPYALTNFAIVIATLLLIASVARRLGLPPLASVVAAGLWALNFHGIGMGLTWVSGRTSLLTTLFAVAAAWALTARRSIASGVLTLCALLSKEEPILLPAIFAVWAWIDAGDDPSARGRLTDVVRRTAPAFLALAVYAVLRVNSLAFTPWDAPEAYLLTLSPAVLARNVLEYADRSSTVVAGVLVLGWLLFARRRPQVDRAERRIVGKGLAWLMLGFGATIMVPTRSDLYACFPSVGSAIAGAAIGAALWRTIPSARQRVAAVGLAALPILLLPVYWSRNAAAKDDALMSTRVVSEIAAALGTNPDADRLVVYERPEDRVSVFSAFKLTLPKAIELKTGKTPMIDVRPLAAGMSEIPDRPESTDTLSFVFVHDAVH